MAISKPVQEVFARHALWHAVWLDGLGALEKYAQSGALLGLGNLHQLSPLQSKLLYSPHEQAPWAFVNVATAATGANVGGITMELS